METGEQISFLQSNYDKDALEANEEKKKNVATAYNLRRLLNELDQYKVGEEGHWEARKKEFLESSEFHELLATRTGFLFDWAFLGAVRQFKKVGYPSDGASIDFLDPNVALAEIPDSHFKD